MSLEAVFDAILDGDAAAAEEAVQQALAAGVPAEDILNHACIPAMSEVGRLYEEGNAFVPEMLISARAMRSAMGVLRPVLVQEKVKPVGTVVIGTVNGDLHDIGKSLVAMMLEGAGFNVIDLGVDVTPARFAQEAVANNAQLVAMSALLTTTMPSMKTTVEMLAERGLAGKVKTLIGGAPISEAYAGQIGADGFAPDASRAARKARELVGLASKEE
jgi:5-methyltetrahydrofolate--homocysteine methyltransferase